MPRIWLDYCSFLMNQCRITKTRRVFDRALKALPITQHPRIWELYLKFAKSVGGETAIRLYRRYLKVRLLLLYIWAFINTLQRPVMVFVLFAIWIYGTAPHWFCQTIKELLRQKIFQNWLSFYGDGPTATQMIYYHPGKRHSLTI